MVNILFINYLSNFIGNVSIDAWIGFVGGIIGAIISGVITFVVLKVTIDNENKKRIEDKEEMDKLRLDEFRQKIYPLFIYDIVYESDITKQIASPIRLFPMDFDKREDEGSELILTFYVHMKNVGQGVALNPHLNKTIYQNKEFTIMSSGSFAVETNEEIVIPFNLVLPHQLNEVKPMTIELGYSNMRQDYYVQTIVMEPLVTTILYQDIGKVDYECKTVKINSTSLPVIADKKKYPKGGFRVVVPENDE